MALDVTAEVNFVANDLISSPLTRMKRSVNAFGDRTARSMQGAFGNSTSLVRKFLGNLSKVSRALSIVRTAAFAVGAAIAGASAALIKLVDIRQNSAQAALDLARQTGTTVEFISRFGFAAEQMGVQTNDVGAALRGLTRRAAALPKNFEKWGVSVKDANGNVADTETLVRRVSERMETMSSRAEQVALADETMSEAGRKLIPVLLEGSEGLERFATESDRVGATVTEQVALLSDKYSRAWRTSKNAITAVAETLGEAAMPMITMLAEVIADTAVVVRTFFEENKDRVIEFSKALLQWLVGAIEVATHAIQGFLMAARPFVAVLSFRLADGMKIAAQATARFQVGLNEAQRRLAETDWHSIKLTGSLDKEAGAHDRVAEAIRKENEARKQANEHVEELFGRFEAVQGTETPGMGKDTVRSVAEIRAEIDKQREALRSAEATAGEQLQRINETEEAAKRVGAALGGASGQARKLGEAYQEAVLAGGDAEIAAVQMNRRGAMATRKVLELEQERNDLQARMQAADERRAALSQRLVSIQNENTEAHMQTAIELQRAEDALARLKALETELKTAVEARAAALERTRRAQEAMSALRGPGLGVGDIADPGARMGAARAEIESIRATMLRLDAELHLMEGRTQEAAVARLEAMGERVRSLQEIVSSSQQEIVQSSLAAQQQAMQNTLSIVQSIGQQATGIFSAMAQGSQDMAQVVVRALGQIVQMLINVMIQQQIAQQQEALMTKQSIAQSAAKGAAETAAQSASMGPIVGLVLAGVLASAMFSLIMGFASKFEKGGMVLGGAPSGMVSRRGEVPIIAHEGEVIVPVDKLNEAKRSRSGGGGGGGTTILAPQIQTIAAPASRVSMERLYRDSLIPSVNRLNRRGKASLKRSTGKGSRTL